jgi:hypothetical protein
LILAVLGVAAWLILQGWLHLFTPTSLGVDQFNPTEQWQCQQNPVISPEYPPPPDPFKDWRPEPDTALTFMPYAAQGDRKKLYQVGQLVWHDGSSPFVPSSTRAKFIPCDDQSGNDFIELELPRGTTVATIWYCPNPFDAASESAGCYSPHHVVAQQEALPPGNESEMWVIPPDPSGLTVVYLFNGYDTDYGGNPMFTLIDPGLNDVMAQVNNYLSTSFHPTS